MTGRGRHRAGTRRRRVLFAGTAVVVAAGAVLAFAVVRDDAIERVCSRPAELSTRGSVVLIPDAMDALVEAESALGFEIDVVQSYRSCREQRAACERICGDPRGCPGTCARPGLSWHQRAAAIDVTQEMLDTPGVIEALEEGGWCQALPSTDPGHFSFGGCH